MSLSTRRARAALDALCRRIVPAAYETQPPVDILAHVEQRIASLEPELRREVVGALHFFDHPITGMFLSGRPRRFSTLPPAEQDALLQEWERSPLALRRTVFQALRRLILATYYTLPEAHRAIGYMAPLHTRAPLFEWEGAARGIATDDEPIARVAAEAPGAEAPQRRIRSYAHAQAAPLPRSYLSPPESAPLAAIHPRAHTHGAEPPLPHAHGAPPDSGIVSASVLRADTVIRADVCVVGSGAGGSVAAAQLARAGFEVLVLEEGGYYTSDDFDDDEGRLAPLLYADGAARATDDLSFILLQGRCVGGGTTVNWLMTLRPQPWVLDEWEREHGIELLSAQVLTPALARMEEAIHARPVPADAHSPSNRIILDGSRQLGWSTLPAHINARGCVRAGACGLGCRWGAKQSAGAVFLPQATAAGARVLYDARVSRIDVGERGTFAPLKRLQVTVLDRATGEARGRCVVETPIVVLAAGAVGTPALLERSGLGGGGVGRWLRLHPTTALFGLYEDTMYGAAGIPQSAVCDEFLQGESGYGFWIECPPLRPGLAAAAIQGFGAEHRARMIDFPRYAPLIVLVRDGADRNRSNGDVRVDRAGRISIRYRMSPADRRTLVRGLQAAAQLHQACGAQHSLTLHVGGTPLRTERDIAQLSLRSYGPNCLSMFSAHVNGTCRLGVDPQKSGCTPEGERHGVPDVWVADGSLFPTAPGVNPQLAIMALASLVAQRISDRHR